MLVAVWDGTPANADCEIELRQMAGTLKNTFQNPPSTTPAEALINNATLK